MKVAGHRGAWLLFISHAGSYAIRSAFLVCSSSIWALERARDPGQKLAATGEQRGRGPERFCVRLRARPSFWKSNGFAAPLELDRPLDCCGIALARVVPLTEPSP